MIKKSIIALAVASSALTGIAQADGTTLYGSVRVAYDYVSIKKEDRTEGEILMRDKEAYSDIANKGSRIGVKGSNDLGDGLSAGYKIELGADGNSREYYVNLNGSFGTLQAGRFTPPYDDIVTYSDLFNGAGGAYLARSGYVTNPIYIPKSNTLAYISPDLSGFKVTAAIVADESGISNRRNKNDDHIDGYQLTAAYENSGFYAGLGWFRINNPKEHFSAEDVIGTSLGYENDTFKVGLSAEHSSSKYSNDGYNYGFDYTFYALAGSFNFNEANKIYASYGLYKETIGDADIKYTDKHNAYGIGYQHNLSDNTRLWAEYGVLDYEKLRPDHRFKKKTSKISIGLRTDF